MNVREVFDVAASISDAGGRAAYLDEVCGSDSNLREEVERLLAIDAETNPFLDEPLAQLDSAIRGQDRIGDTIGPYRLLDRLGEGGMGTVYLAEQSEPVARKVALKVVKFGFDTRQIIARFDSERQALAVMDHAGIAKVYDAGSTDDGRPYFAMELVEGVPITEYCDQRRLDPRQRLALFVSVCEAVQHAHQKGILHRDLKPSNILVTELDGEPLPKIIDFGLAKAIGQPLAKQTALTLFGQVLGTLQYMSPEQTGLSSHDVDTRADIYALGVLLYELLTSTTPLSHGEIHGAGVARVLELIREHEPPYPSKRLQTVAATVAAQRDTLPGQLQRLVTGDLDLIVMKALEKDRERRYDSASELAADMARYLSNDPITARPPTASYRLRKLAAKYRVPATLCASFVVLVALGALVSTTLWFRAVRAESHAREQAAIASEVTRFLSHDVLKQADPALTPDRSVKLRTVLDTAAEPLRDRFAGRPQVEATDHLTLANAYRALGDREAAESHAQIGRELAAE